MVRVILPFHLQNLAQSPREISLDVQSEPTQNTLIDAIETRYPMLRGTIRDAQTKRRRALVRFFACGEDLSHENPDAPLLTAVAQGMEPFIILGAIAGG
jgi:molybdopterin synthase sulfur carrier subunit